MPRPRSSSSLPLTFLLVTTTITCGILSLASSSRDHGVEGELLMMERFHAWMAEHGRTYATADEKQRRFEIYRRKVEYIEATNRDGGLSYQLGENKFTDLTREEFLAMYAGNAAPPVITARRAGDITEGTASPVITTRAGDITEGGSTVDLLPPPESVDWRDKGAVTHVKDQGQCNTCWVFAGMAAIESAHKIEKGKLVSLSEQQIVDCFSGCGRGWPAKVYGWVHANGVAAESDYATYNATVGSCDKSKRSAVKVDSYNYVKNASEYDLAIAVARHPVAVLFDSHDPNFESYKDGVYSGPWKAERLTHAMAIVGYGKDAATGKKYWIAKNSWGTSWGQKGYVYLHKDLSQSPEGLCGLAINPSYPVIY